MNIKGKIIAINETEIISENFQKRSFALEHGDNPQYLEKCLFEFHQDKVSLLDGFNLGDLVDIKFNLKGREWTNPQGEIKYFNTLGAWKIEKDNGTHDISEAHQDIQDMAEEKGMESDDLPF
jgi:hypothetical protein